MKIIQQFKYALVVLLFVLPNVLAQPTLLTPTNGATDVSLTPTLTWSNIGSTTYRVEVATDAAFSSLAYTNDGVVGTSQITGSLNNYTLYYWHVRESAPSTGTYSSTFTFRTLPSATPVAPTLGTPADGATGQALSPTFTWGATTETDSYTFELATDAGFTSIISSQPGLTSPTASVVGLTVSTPYYWRVRGTNFLGTGSNSSTNTFTTLGAPTLTSPANTISGVSIQTAFGWSAVPGAATYDLDISIDNFATTLLSKPGLVTNSYTLDSTEILNNISTYYWRVKADITPYSSTSSFVTLPAAMPQPNSPVGNATVFTLTPTLYWHLNQPITNVIYDVQYRRSTDVNFIQVATNTALQTVTLPTLEPNTTYLWRVIAKRTDFRVCSYSPSVTFTTAFGGDPIASWPLGAQTVYTTTPTLYWYHNEPQLTNRYLVEVYNNPTFTGLPLFKDSTTSQNITTSALVPSYYYWRVHATSTITGTISGWSSGSFLVYFITTPDVTLSWPIGGATVYNVQPVLNWYLDSAYTGITFNVEYNTVGIGGPWISAGSTANQYLTFPIYVAPGTTYYWRVQATSPSTGDGSWTAAASFVVDPAASGYPTVPIISWPTAGSTIFSFNHAMNWYLNGPTDGLVYDGNIASDAGFTNLAATWTGLSTLYYNAVLPNSVATYYWRVKSRNPITLEESAYATTATPFTVNPIGTAAPTPILDYPTNGTIVWTNTQTLFWYVNNTPAGTNFQVQLSIYGNFSVLTASNAADTAAGFSATSYPIPVSLLSGYTYYWRVRSRIGTNHDDWSAWVSTNFITDPGFSSMQPQIGGPLDGINVSASNIQLNWFVPVREQNQSKYEIQYSTNSDFANATTVSDITSKKYVVSSLTKGTKYFWRVRSIGKDGSISGYSESESFIPTQPSDISPENVVPQTFELSQNYPNPFNPTTIISYGIPQNSVVTLSIYNMLGQKIKTLVSEQKNAGTYSVQWNGDNEFGQKVSSGAYIYKINTGNFVKSMKLILMK
jgi:hypothetical protein